MGTAQVQGALWSTGAQDWANLHEQMHLPAYMAVFAALDLSPEMSLLDVGCGTGLALQLAALQVERVAGIDASRVSIDIAQERVPTGSFIIGEMEELPYQNATFDVILGCSSFPYAENPIQALKEAARVLKPEGKIAVIVWGKKEECEHATTLDAVGAFLPASNKPGPFALSEEGKLETFLKEAGLSSLESGQVSCPFFYPDQDTALRAICASGVVIEAMQYAGKERVVHAIQTSLQPFRLVAGAIYQRNTFRYAIATVAAAGAAKNTELGEQNNPEPLVA